MAMFMQFQSLKDLSLMDKSIKKRITKNLDKTVSDFGYWLLNITKNLKD